MGDRWEDYLVETPESPISLETAPATLTPAAEQPKQEQGIESLPDLTALHWETVPSDDGPVRQLAGLGYPIFPVDLSPDGRFLIVAIGIGSDGEAAEAVVDTQGDSHWWLNTHTFVNVEYLACYHDYYRTRWLPDGRLLWVDETGEIYVSSGPGLRENLNAPQPMYVQYATNDIAFGRAENGSLWRVDLASSSWEEVTTSIPPRVGTLGGYFHLAQDGSYGLAFQEGQMWRVPAQIGAVAEPLPEVAAEIVGMGGPLPPNVQLSDTPYWLINLPIVLEGELADGIWGQGFVVDVRNGRRLIAADMNLPERYYLIGYSASPSGRWLAVTLWQKETDEKALYVTPTSDLTTGSVINNGELSVVGWLDETPRIIFSNETTGMLSVSALPLSSEFSSGSQLPGAGSLLATLPGIIFATVANNPALVLQFDVEGNLVNRLDLSAYWDTIKLAIAADNHLFLSAFKEQSVDDGVETYALVEWTVTGTATPLPEPVSLFPGDSFSPAISGDGRFVAFVSNAGDLVPEAVSQCPAPGGSRQNCANIYVFDRQAQRMQLVSRSSEGTPANGNSREPQIAADGRWVVFSSDAANLDRSRTFQFFGGFLHDLQRRTPWLISGRNASRSPSISADGRFVAFAAMDDVGWNVYVYDQISEETERVSLNYHGGSPDGDSIEPRISAHGKWAAFWSWAGDLVADDTEVCRDQEPRNYSCGDVFLFERSTGNIQRLEAGAGYGIGMGAFPLSLSDDGQWLTFADSIYDRLENKTDPLVCNQGQGCGGAILSGNGQWWAYADGPNVYVVNRLNGEAELVSVSDEGTPGNGDIVDFIFTVEGGGFEPGFDLSENGRWAVFSANATNLAAKTKPTCDDAFLGRHNCYEIFVRDRELEVTEWISKPSAEN